MKSHRLQKSSDFLKIFTGSSLAHPQGRKNLATHNCDVMQNDEGTISYVNRFNMCIEDVFGQLSHNSNCCICPPMATTVASFLSENQNGNRFAVTQDSRPTKLTNSHGLQTIDKPIQI